MSPRPSIAEIVVAGEPGAWSQAGFLVSGGSALVGSVLLRLAGAEAGRGIVSWALRDVSSRDLDGLPTTAPSDERRTLGPAHANGVARLDHVVAFSPDLARSVPALQAAGLDLRRVREGPTAAGAQRQAFFRLGETLLELVEHPPDTPAARDPEAPSHFYGLAFLVADLDATAAHLGPLLGEPRDAVQPGRRIATVRREAALGPPVAIMNEP